MLDLDQAQKTGNARPDLNDYTTWHINEIGLDPIERTPQKIAKRLMTVNFAAIHTSTFTATNLLFDFYSSPLVNTYVKEIREEVAQALSESGGKWDKNTIVKLIKTDSAVRESLRISTFMSTGMDRVVVDPHGATMTNGLHLPQGTRLGTSTYAIHHDDSIYENAMTYDAFRFSRPREIAIAAGKARMEGNGTEKTQGSVKKKELAKLLESKNLATVTTSDTFLYGSLQIFGVFQLLTFYQFFRPWPPRLSWTFLRGHRNEATRRIHHDELRRQGPHDSPSEFVHRGLDHPTHEGYNLGTETKDMISVVIYLELPGKKQ
jgi:hypothetical protein